MTKSAKSGENLEKQRDTLRVELWSVDWVTPYAKNPRKNDKTVKSLAKSIQTFGWMRPIGVDSDGVTVFGHTAYAAARELGLSEVPVVVLAHLTTEQVRQFRIDDNGTGMIVRFDEGLLLGELDKIGDFSAETLGFSDEEFNKLLNAAAGKEPPLPERYDVIVECESFEQMQDEAAFWKGKGYPCKTLLN